MNNTPNPIKNYYIAYFDILGYKDFFNTQPDKVPELLDKIHDVVRRTKEHIGIANQSFIMSRMGQIDIKEKIFSDNFLICLEVMEGPTEQVRLLAFLQIIADIQRGFVNDYGLFVRGDVCKGFISFNEDYVFGEGLIKAVEIEDKEAQYPRLIIDSEIIHILQNNIFYSEEDQNRALEIEKKIGNNVEVSEDELVIYNSFVLRMKFYISLLQLRNSLEMPCFDGKWMLNYLSNIDISAIWSDEAKNIILNNLQKISPLDYALANKPTMDIEEVLKQHKNRVEDKLRIFGNNNDIETGDDKSAKLREKVLRKYIWIMAYHNDICDICQKPDLKILTKSNCDRRFVNTTIEVLE